MSRLRGATGDVAERLEFAADAARRAGEMILGYYGRVDHTVKAGGSPVTAADLAANEFLVETIGSAWPGEPVLAEESWDAARGRTGRLVWVVDPLDGTREFLAGNGEFSVMVGLLAEGVPAVGAIHLPARRLLYGAAGGCGAWVSGVDGVRRRLHCAGANVAALRMVISRSHAHPLLEAIQRELRVVEVRRSGSVGVKCALIAEGECDLYVHPSAQLREWDTCAPEVLVREAGGAVTDCRGDALRYHARGDSQPHGMVACGRDVLASVLSRIVPLYEDALGEGAGERVGGDLEGIG